MPGRRTPPIPARLAPQWPSSALTSVPSGLPGAGWTTMPGRLVDDDQMCILKADIERDRLRYRRRIFKIRENYDKILAAAYPRRWVAQRRPLRT